MKLQHTLLIALAGLGLATVQAQQPDAPPPPPAPPPGEAPPGPARSEGWRERDRPDERKRGMPQEKAVAYMGVLTREVPAELRSQFSLPDGFGLMVDEVMPDSPAQAAGIKVHDILVKLGDQQLVNMEQLMTLVRARKKGESVSLSIITGGKEAQVQVTLGERLMPAVEQRDRGPGGGGFGWPQMHTFHFGDMRGPGGDMREGMEKMQQAIREYQERIQQWARNGQQGPMPQMQPLPGMSGPDGRGPRRGGGVEHREEHRESRSGDGNASASGSASAGGRGGDVRIQIDSNTASQIVRRDDSGEYIFKREDGKATFTVRPTNGQEQSWPVNNDQERAAVPREFQDKLRLFDSMPGQRPANPPGNPAPPAPNGPQRRPASA